MKLILFTFLIFFQLHPFIGYSEHYLDNLNVSCLEDKKKEENSSDAENQQRVYICTGQYAYAYHSRPDCPGLNNCKGEIRYTDEHTAINRLERIPCCRCWSNVAGRCKDDNPYNQSTTTFNPYVPQGKSSSSGGESYAAAAGIILATGLVAAIITDMNNPEAKARRAQYKAKKKQDRIKKREDKKQKKFVAKYKRKVKNKPHKTDKKSLKAEAEEKLNTLINTPNKPKSKLQGDNDYAIRYQIETTFDTPLSDIALRKKPKTKSDIIYLCPNDAKVFVIDNRGEFYCKVSVNGHIGYVLKSFLKKPY